ncbi:hypothetical protein MF271_08355 [Deinococcus sp. KNUC1210]|uniref:hypothetical protein n=1 Tax=Deinococcus sp. KNUC1210 TaxID=2917691 RepID=UPI001EF0B73F|nr:hypothetical protein [Deinococcus sp. KNUC1210]ULH16571.1 hypothetical protein MF271_08355 [Deinococcus sp. KNUC1210]
MNTPDPRQGTRFAVYLCPEADSPYYQLGSTLLGYDVRAQRQTELPAWIDPAWQTAAAPYGLHLTLVEGFSCDAADLPAIEEEVRGCMACLSPHADLHLSGGQVEAWNGGAVLAHVFTPSPHLLMLHAFLLARLSRFVTHSPFEDELAEHPERYQTPWEQARMRLLRTPRGLDSFQPHFTLVQPYTGPDPEGLRSRLQGLVAGYGEQRYHSVSLFVKPGGEERWQLRAEIGRAAAATSPS